MANKLNNYTASDLLEMLKKKEITIKEICIDCLEAIEKQENNIKAWEYLSYDLVIANAELLDKKRKITGIKSLSGIPIGIKDVFNTKDMPTTMGSSIWKGFTPGNDARVVHYLRESDALIMGKTVTAEFAVHYLAADKTVNPHNYEHIPGTSSSGSAAAVASEMIPLSIGTQTAGSIIRPASYCGVYGFKSSFGVIPRTGTLKTTDTLDTIGCFGRSIEDISLLFESMRIKGPDYPIVEKKLKKYNFPDNGKIKIGYITRGINVLKNSKEYTISSLLDFINKLRSNNKFEIEEIKPITQFNKIHNIHSIIYDKTLSYYFQVEYGKEITQLSPVMKWAIDRGKKISFQDYIKALEKQTEISAVIHSQLKGYDVIFTTAAVGEAPKFGEPEIDDTCLIWTFLGMPVLNLPLFRGPNNLPFGIQAIANKYDDYKLLEITKYILAALK